MRSRMRAPAAALVLGLVLHAGGFAVARSGAPFVPPATGGALPPGVLVAPFSPLPVVTGCRVEPRLFFSLRTGWIDYCRGHLGFAPGAPDCFNFTDQVCTVFVPLTQQWTETRYDNALPAVFPCPAGPEPPTCPRLGP